MNPKVAVIGGGISGLSTAYFLRRQLGDALDLTVLDAEPVLGGKLRTRTVAGLPVDTGPDAFLSRAPELSDLVDDLGLRGEVVGPAASGAFIWSRGRLRPLPAGATFGLPERVLPMVRSGLISIPGAARAALDLVLPTSRRPADPSVEELVRPRFGTEVYERMVEPLLGGVHAGSAAVLSARSTVPEIVSLATSGRSMILTMRGRKKRAPRPTSPPAPALVSVSGGMERLTAALAEALGPESIRTGSRVLAVAPLAAGGYEVTTDDACLTVDHVVLTVPAHACAPLVEAFLPEGARLLREIPYVDVASAVLAYRRADLPALPPGTGFLVPPVEGEFIVGSTWLTSKWPHLVNDDIVILRNLVGRYGDTRWMGMDDDEIVATVRDGLRRMAGIEADPIETLVQRWPGAMPQYVVGHAQRLQSLDAALAAHPGLHLSGAAYRGVGLAGCVAQGHATAARIVEGARP